MLVINLDNYISVLTPTILNNRIECEIMTEIIETTSYKNDDTATIEYVSFTTINNDYMFYDVINDIIYSHKDVQCIITFRGKKYSYDIVDCGMGLIGGI